MGQAQQDTAGHGRTAGHSRTRRARCGVSTAVPAPSRSPRTSRSSHRAPPRPLRLNSKAPGAARAARPGRSGAGWFRSSAPGLGWDGSVPPPPGPGWFGSPAPRVGPVRFPPPPGLGRFGSPRPTPRVRPGVISQRAEPKALPDSDSTRGPFAFHLSRTERFGSGMQGWREGCPRARRWGSHASREHAGKEPCQPQSRSSQEHTVLTKGKDGTPSPP